VSTILKALQRLEDEKNANSERSLDQQVVARRPPPHTERHWLRIGAVAIGGVAVAAAAIWFWPTREDPDAGMAMESPPAAAAPAATTEHEVAAEEPRRRPSARPAPAARAQQDSSEVEVSSVVEVVKRLDAPPATIAELAALAKHAAPSAKTGRERPAGRRRNARQSDPQVASKPDPQVARGDAQPRPAPKQVASAKPPATQISENSAPAKPIPAPPAPVQIAAVAPKPAPTAAPAPIPTAIREPEQVVVMRAEIPTLSVEKTIWHPDADRRVVVVKLVDAEEVLRLKEGDAVGPLVVQAIEPGSVLFNHDGIEIVYNVGS
jgi:hypothetical protein